MQTMNQSPLFTDLSTAEAANVNGAWGGYYYYPVSCYYPVYYGGGYGGGGYGGGGYSSVNQSVNVNVQIDD